MRIGIYGGAFNPIHNGHLHLIACAEDSLKLNRVLFIPCNTYAFDSKFLGNTVEHRCAMVLMALQDHTDWDICTIEANKKGKSFTIDTIKELKKIYKRDELHLILGPDIGDLYNAGWKKASDIVKEVYIDRAGIDFYIEPLNIRSTMIREHIKKKLPIAGFVPYEVERYIYDEGLYK